MWAAKKMTNVNVMVQEDIRDYLIVRQIEKSQMKGMQEQWLSSLTKEELKELELRPPKIWNVNVINNDYATEKREIGTKELENYTQEEEHSQEETKNISTSKN